MMADMSAVKHDEGDDELLDGMDDLFEEPTTEENFDRTPKSAFKHDEPSEDEVDPPTPDPMDDETADFLAELAPPKDGVGGGSLFDDGGAFDDEDELLAQLRSAGAEFQEEIEVESGPSQPVNSTVRAKPKQGGGGKGPGVARTPVSINEQAVRAWWNSTGKNIKTKHDQVVGLAKHTGADVKSVTYAFNEILKVPVVYQAVRASMIKANLHQNTPRSTTAGPAPGATIPTHPRPQQSGGSGPAPAGAVAAIKDLRARVAVLEERVKQLEGALALAQNSDDGVLSEIEEILNGE